MAAPPDLPDNVRQTLLERLRAKTPRVVNLSPGARAWTDRCGMLDAVVILSIKGGARPTGRAAVLRARQLSDGSMARTYLAFPPGAEAAVQQEAYRLFATEPWPADTRWRLWVWLGVFTLAAGVAAALISRRRAAVAVAVLVGLAAGAGAFIWFEGDLRAAPIREARIFYASWPGEAMAEDFVSWASRGKEVPRLPVSADLATPLPLPVLPSSEALLAPQMTLDLGDPPHVSPWRDQLLIHTLTRVQDHPFGVLMGTFGHDALGTVAKRPGAIAALLVEGDLAADAAGRSQTVDAWSAEWAASSDADLAYAGRSLHWWAKDRRDGPGPVILVWWLDTLPPAEGGLDYVRLPALVVYQSP